MSNHTPPRVLVACEESQAVTIALRGIGIDAFSCDLEPCSGGHPEWHLQQDVLPLLDSGEWDMILAFPPCTHLGVAGAVWFKAKRADSRQQAGIDFFLRCIHANCDRIAVENPVGIMSHLHRRPDQIIQPWYFGDEFSKTTCLWLKNLPRLKPTNIVGRGEQIEYASGNVMPKWYADAYHLSPKERAAARSKTFPGIANAMADQWGRLLLEPTTSPHYFPITPTYAQMPLLS